MRPVMRRSSTGSAWGPRTRPAIKFSSWRGGAAVRHHCGREREFGIWRKLRYELQKLIADLADQRGSFGFLETTCTTFALEETWVARISAGQESRAELIETFFGLGRMLRPGRRQGRLSEPAPADNPSSRKLGQPVTFDLQQMLSEANKTAASAAMVVMERVPPEVWVDQALRILRRRSAAGEHVATGEGQRDAS